MNKIILALLSTLVSDLPSCLNCCQNQAAHIKMLIIVYFRSSIGIIGCLLARRNGLESRRFFTNPVSLCEDGENGNLDFNIE